MGLVSTSYLYLHFDSFFNSAITNGMDILFVGHDRPILIIDNIIFSDIVVHSQNSKNSLIGGYLAIHISQYGALMEPIP